jgi:hypothetical protein
VYQQLINTTPKHASSIDREVKTLTATFAIFAIFTNPQLDWNPRAYRHCEYQSLTCWHVDPAAHVLQPV